MLKRIDIFLCDKDVCATLIKKYFSKEEQKNSYIKALPINALIYFYS